jgi:hypothetical protein
MLLIEVLRSNATAGKFQLDDFVIMPDHLHLLMTEVQIRDGQSLLQHHAYILQNPVKAGLVDSAAQYPYSYTYLAKKKAQGLEARIGVDRERPG